MRHTLLATALAYLPLVGCASTPESPAPEVSAGWTRLELNDANGALAFFDTALESAPIAENHAGRARALSLMGRLEEARTSYEEAIACDPDETRWRMGLAAVELARGDSRAAIAACEAALEIDPRLAKAFYNRGYARLRMLEYGGAVDDFTQAIEIEPRYAEAYNSRGVALARTDEADAALEDFRQAARIAPLASAHGNSAAAYYAMGEVQVALSELNFALRLDRGNPVYHTNRGRIYLALGQADLAAADFEQALALAPAAPGLPQLLARARGLVPAPEAGDPARALENAGTPEPAALSVSSDD